MTISGESRNDSWAVREVPANPPFSRSGLPTRRSVPRNRKYKLTHYQHRSIVMRLDVRRSHFTFENSCHAFSPQEGSRGANLGLKRLMRDDRAVAQPTLPVRPSRSQSSPLAPHPRRFSNL